MSKIRALYCWTWLFSLSFVLLSQCAFSQAVYPKSAESFTFQNEQVSAGSKKHFTVEISSDEHTTTMPITIFQGSQEGPVVGITTGVHGYEYAPILAGQQLIKKINPKDLKGTLILVQIANVESFLNRSPYFNPQDGKNLNRVFPGSESGTITEKLAHFITTEIISKCDYFVDIHSGDAPEDLMPYAAYYQHDDMPDISIKGK